MNKTITCVVLEATGPYHVKLHQELDNVGFPVAVINPYQSRKFADICGRLAKTDRIDAETLAKFAQHIDPPITPAPTDLMIEINGLIHAREALITDRTTLKNRIESTPLERLRVLLESVL